MLTLSFRNQRLLVIIGTIIYALWQTGLATDDFVFLRNSQENSLASSLWPTVYFSVPLLHYTHALMYFLFGEYYWAYDLLKAAYLTFCFLAAWRFFSIFYGTERAFFGALCLLLSPLHDAATLWLTGQYLILSLGFYMWAYTRAHEDRDFQAAVLATCGSFCSYGSPPLAVGFALMFAWQRRWKAALLLLIPNVAYSLFYFYTSVIMSVGIKRLQPEYSLGTLAKSYVAQIGSLVDASVGPSAWLKFALSIASLSWLSLAVGLGLAAWLWRTGSRLYSGADAPTRRVPLIGGATIVALALGIFALNGKYPQVAFNLGDRVMIYADLFAAILLMHLARPRILAGATIVTVFAFLGISDHWKEWNYKLHVSANQIVQLNVATRPNSPLFVTGLQYSRLGPMTHIDHFTATYVVQSFFDVARHGKAKISVASFNRRLELQTEDLYDIKYGERTPVGDTILLYDADSNTLSTVPKGQIVARISNLPMELRHWTQLLGPGLLRDAILWFMPRLKYAYPG